METQMTPALVVGAILTVWVLSLVLRSGSKKKLAAKLAAGATVIDVRTPAEFSGGAYPGAKNIPLDKLRDKLAKLGPKDQAIVVYCASGGRSAAAAQLLRAEGFTDVTNGGALAHMPPAADA